MKNPIYYLATLLIFLSYSCATIFTGTKAKIKIKSNVSGLEFKVNGNPVKFNEKKSQIAFSKKIKSPLLEISRPGYEPQKLALTRNKLSWNILNGTNISVGPCLVALGVLFANGSLNGESIDDKGVSTPIDNTSYAMPFYGLGGLMMVSAIVDYASGAQNNIAHKELEFDMIPTPGRVKAENMEVIACNSLSFKIKTGSEIGNVYACGNKTFKLIKSYKWDESSNIEIEELKIQNLKKLSEMNQKFQIQINEYKQYKHKTYEHN